VRVRVRMIKTSPTQVSPPPAPLRMSSCECGSFAYDQTPPNADGLVVSFEDIKQHLGGTRQFCVPCYSLAGKFGSAPFTQAQTAITPTTLLTKQTVPHVTYTHVQAQQHTPTGTCA
jgi:hypothetical protein